MKVSLIKDQNGITFYTIPNLRDVQLLMLELLKIVDIIARRNNIPYWIDGGTLVGAVRHKGFIPWDDDIDICLMKEDYDRLLPLLYNYIKDSEDLSLMYYKNDHVQHWSDYLASREISIEFNGVKKPTRIDIFPMKLIINDREEIKTDRFITDLSGYYTSGKVKYFSEIKDNNKFTSLKDALQAKKMFFRMFHLKHLNKNIDIVDRKDLLVDYSFGDNYIKGKRDYKKYSDIFPLKEIEFEGVQIMCPNSVDNYLVNIYGDYMRLPPIENRKQTHNNKILIGKNKITKDEVYKYLIEQNQYFYFANKISYKFHVLFRQIKSNGFANAYYEIIKPFLSRVLN